MIGFPIENVDSLNVLNSLHPCIHPLSMASRQVGRPKVDFEEHKDTLYRLYITERRSMDEVRQCIVKIYSQSTRT
jgi:Clr5 domain